jgi:hypothetical protein
VTGNLKNFANFFGTKRALDFSNQETWHLPGACFAISQFGLVRFGWNGSERGLFHPDRIGPVGSQAGSRMVVRLDTARIENRSIRAFSTPL